MLIEKKPLKNGTNRKKSKAQSHGWLIIYHSFISSFMDDENEETLK